MFLSDGKQQTQNVPIRELPIPRRLVVPLAQRAERPAEPTVEPGDQVQAGQLLAAATVDDALAVHAPVDAVVTAVGEADTPYRERVSAIELQANGDWPAPLSLTGLPGRLSRGELHDAAAAAGVYLPETLPAGDAPKTEWLIINGLETELVQTVGLRTLIEQPDEVVTAAEWVRDSLNARRGCLVVSRRRKAVVRRLGQAVRGTDLDLIALPDKYPGSLVPPLVRSVTGQEVPCGGRAIDIGVCVVAVWALPHLWRAAHRGVAQTHTLVTVAGESVQRPGCYRVPLGAAVSDVAAHVGLRAADVQVVADNIMSGQLVRHPRTVLTKGTHLLLFSPGRRPSPHPPLGCIRCGLCLDICPVGLDPRALLDLVERRRFDLVSGRFPAACLDCGLCDYVCPSALPLMRAVQRSREHAHGD